MNKIHTPLTEAENKRYLAFSMWHEKEPNIAITLSQDKRHATEQILNAIFLYQMPCFSDMVQDFIKIKDIYSKHPNSVLDDLLLLYIKAVSYLHIEDNPKASHSINISFSVGMLFSSPSEKQAYADRWFKAKTGMVKFNGRKLKFSNRFLKAMMEEALRQFRDLDHNHQDKLIWEHIMPVVEQYDAFAMVDVESVFNQYLADLEGNNDEMV